MKSWQKVVGGAVAALVLAAALAVNARAQDPVGGALATLAAATRQAEGWRQASQAAAQAAQWRAQQAATATAQAQDAAAAATRIALDELASRQAAAATATVGSYRAQATATAGAYQAQAAATATAYGAQAGATATALAQDTAATAVAYNLAYQASRQQAELGRNVLYLAGGLALAGLAWVILAWARALARRFERRFEPAPAAWSPAGGMVIDAHPALPAASARMPEQVRVIQDSDLGDKIEAWFYGSTDHEDF